MTDVLDVVGLLALVVAAFLLAVWIGFAVLGTCCIAASYTITAKKRRDPARRRQA